MNKSTTNRNFPDHPDVGIVSGADLGKRVLVNGNFGGILRYFGPVEGQQGIFCGVELDQPVGKNDGIHKGISYFQCRPNHGVFAPCHKIRLEQQQEEEEEGPERMREKIGTKRMIKEKEVLSRSAMPALAMDLPQPNTKQPEAVQSMMDWSLMSMSTGSTNSGFSMAKCDEDMMAHSQATYTVFESDCLMLSDLELSDSALLRLDEDEMDADGGGGNWTMSIGGWHHPRPDESIILDGPTFGMDLPVIGSPEPAEETPTPMVEKTDFLTGFNREEKEEEDADRRNRNHLKLHGLAKRHQESEKGGMTTAPAAVEYKSPNNNYDRNMAKEPPNSNNNNNHHHMMGEETTNGNINKSPAAAAAAGMMRAEEEEGLLEAGKGSRGEKKSRVSVFQSVPMPSQNLSAVARSKPKMPSKATMLMEQLKASMEAEKQKPKKEIRPKVQTVITLKRGEEEESSPKTTTILEESPSQSQPHEMFLSKSKKILRKPTRTDTDQPVICNSHSQQSNKEKIGTIRTASATSTSTSTRFNAYSIRSSSTAKHSPSVLNNRTTQKTKPIPTNHVSRQVLTSKENTASASGPGPGSSTNKPPHSLARQLSKKSSSSESVAKSGLKQGFGLFNKTVSRHGQGHDSKTPAKAAEDKLYKTRQLLEKNKSYGAGVNIILASHLSYQSSISDKNIAKLEELLVRKEQDHAEHTNKIQDEHACSVNELELFWQKKHNDAYEQHKEEIHQMRASLFADHQNELKDAHAKTQKIIDGLNDQLNMLKLRMEEQEIKHQKDMAENETERFKRLNNELTSVQYALQMKNEEVQKLRMENRELIIKAEKIPEKDANIIKLEMKNDDLKEEVNRLRQIERSIITQLTESRRDLEETRLKIKGMEKEKEVLAYQLEEHFDTTHQRTLLNSVDRTPAKARDFSPTSISFRSLPFTPEQRRNSAERPNSSCLPLSHHKPLPTTFENEMSKSMDATATQSTIINCYRQEGRSKSHNTPNKVYTPRETYELKDPPSSAKRMVNFDKECSLDADSSVFSPLIDSENN